MPHPITRRGEREDLRQFREHERPGRVLGDEDFQKRLEKKLGHVLRRQKPGPKKVWTGSWRMASPEITSTLEFDKQQRDNSAKALNAILDARAKEAGKPLPTVDEFEKMLTPKKGR
ncbi:MAG: hypothetical protein ACYC35_14650 [Pirellulales bacterium]